MPLDVFDGDLGLLVIGIALTTIALLLVVALDNGGHHPSRHGQNGR